MKSISFKVPGKAIGKQRPRVTRRGHAYTPKKTKEYEKHIQACFLEEHQGHKPWDCALKMTLVVYSEIPQSWSNKKKEKMAWMPCDKKPDLDNICKAICDALEKLAYTNDSRIAEMVMKKVYTLGDSGVTVIIETLGE